MISLTETDAPALADQNRDTWPVDVDPRFVASVMELWDQKKDTAEIAQILFNSSGLEHRCCVALSVGREQRRSGG